jgi:hypothetical protein
MSTIVGPKKKKKVKKAILEEAFRSQNEPRKVMQFHPPSMTADIKSKIIAIVDRDKLFYSIPQIAEKLMTHLPESQKINPSRPTIQKVLRSKKYFWKKIKILKRAPRDKSRTDFIEKKSLAQTIYILIYSGYTFYNGDEVKLVLKIIKHSKFFDIISIVDSERTSVCMDSSGSKKDLDCPEKKSGRHDKCDRDGWALFLTNIYKGCLCGRCSVVL